MTWGGEVRSAGLLLPCTLASGVGALLFMQVQPLVGRVLSPQLGGAPGVWVTCLAFFQLLLFAGYVWAHLLVRRLALRAQLVVQGLLLLAVIARGPLSLPGLGVDALAASPAWLLLAYLLQHVAPSALVLATTAPLMQAWYAAVGGAEPYALYAVSNAGSIAGLLSYPLLLEPWLGLVEHQQLWVAGFVAYALLVLAAAAATWRASLAGAGAGAPSAQTRDLDAERGDRGTPITLRQAALWTALSAAPSALLAAVSNHITVDVPSLPLFWIAPLVLYLGSFVVTFSRGRELAKELHAALWIACTVAMPILLMPGNETHLAVALSVPLLTLWSGAVSCHGRLAALQPASSHLTAYYGCLAAGGAAGGGFVAFVAPEIFVDHHELVLSMLAIHGLLFALARRRERRPASGAQRLAWLGFGLAMPVLIATLCVQVAGLGRSGHLLARSRNFFGPLHVMDLARLRVLTHGRTDQGQALRDPARRFEPVGYVGPETAAGRALRLHAPGRARKLGVVGLGVGALAAYARAGDSLRFYEINPAMAPLAQRWFGFLAHSRASVAIVPGDGRLALQREAPHAFDVLVLDAFSSDAVPAHLLTAEAFGVYLRQLAADGLLLVNASNRHLRVDRVVAGSARKHRLAYVALQSPASAVDGLQRACWVAMAREPRLLDPLRGPPASDLPVEPVLWSDDRQSLLPVVRR